METSYKSTNCLTKQFQDNMITDPNIKSKVLFRHLWEKNERPLMLIHWLRRFGWSLCRIGAQDLSDDLKAASDHIANYLSYSAIGLAELDYEDFYEGKYFDIGKIYVDQGKETYRALGFGSKGICCLFGMANPMVYFKAYEAKKRGISGNMKGDGTQLGGTIIVDKEGNVIFSHKQKEYVDKPNIEDIIDAVKKYVEKKQ